MTIEKQIELIAEAFNRCERIPFKVADKLIDLMDRAPQEALKMLADKQIKFVSAMAKRRLTDS